MKPVMQMRVGWSLATADGAKFQESASFTPYELPAFDPRAEGFGDITVDLTPRAPSQRASAPVSVEEGRRLYQLSGAWRATRSSTTAIARLGPTWKGLYGQPARFANGVVPR